jgi:alkylated DNA repair dioxygenase AlkB
VIGFSYNSKWADAVSTQNLIETLKWEQPSIKLYGKEVKIPRLTCWMGEGSYTYSGHKNIPVTTPEIITQIQGWIESYTGAKFNSVLANYYRDGSDSVSWHSDDEKELGNEPVIASLSFGASRSFGIKSKATGERTTLILNHGDLVVMSGRSQLDYLHCVPKTAKKVGARVNLTFRRTM